MADYAGDIDPLEAWDLLKSNPQAQLIDVRTRAEWNYVGVPDLTSLGRKVHCVEWQSFPDGGLNPNFVTETEAAIRGTTTDTPVLFICRSGTRSRDAAIAMTQAGFTAAYNVACGFEGGLDAARHRGCKSGWKVVGLPWKQS